MSITVLTDLKTHLGITDSSQDTKLSAILAGAEALVKSWARDAGIILEKETVTEDLDGQDSTRLFLSFRPVLAVTKVYQSLVWLWDATTELAATKFRLYKPLGMLKRADGGTWLDGVQSVHVEYSAGYDPAPADLKQGIVTLAAFFAGQAGKEGKASETIGSYSYSLQDLQLSAPAVKMLLDPYVNRPVVL